MISRVDHIAIAVKNFDAAFRFLTEILGAVPGTSAQDPGMKYCWENFSLGDLSRLELLTPTGSGSFLDKFLSDKEGGVHHMTLQTPDINGAREVLDENAIPHFGFNDFGPVWKELFIHPRDAFGVLIQLAEFNADDWISPSVRMARGARWLVEKSEKGTTLQLAHPGGGKVSIDLDRDEVKMLLNDLKKSLGPDGEHEK
jgi:methylmalonyl-CoA/ethylmalonyl-CoA epimerase